MNDSKREAHALVAQASRAVADGCPAEDVIPSLERALSLDPTHSGAAYELALALDAVGRRDDAVKTLRMSLELEERADALVALGWMLRQADRAASDEAFARAASLYPLDAAALNAVGVSAFERGDFTGAVAKFRAAAAASPDDEGIRVNLRDALEATGDVDGARRQNEELSRIAKTGG
jgi:Flp pilus assembly protein TadD